MVRQQQIYQIAMKKTPELDETHPNNKNLDTMELFRQFKKYDRNMNGTLSFSEYTKCLNECPGINLTKQEIITIAMQADTNGDGVIDFEEFMKHFPDILNVV
jgi:Ca2+-binding EF-hand superfamily protein